METTILYRPVGLKEMELISLNNYKEFPPRLNWQPIFYPVLNETYACQIAFEWNTKDNFSGYIGIVTKFSIKQEFIQKYEIQNVGGEIHNEYWIPSEELHSFNKNIIGTIEIINVFFGENYKASENIELEKKLKKYRKKDEHRI